MVTIQNIRAEDFENYQAMFGLLEELYGTYAGSFFRFEIDGEEGILHRINNYFTLIWIDSTDKEGIYYQTFSVNDDYKIETVELEEYILMVYNDGPLLYDSKKDIYMNLHVSPREEEDVDGFNGVLSFIQFSLTNKTRASIQYQYMINDKMKRGFVYPFHFRKPFVVSFEDYISLRDHGIKLPGTSRKYMRLSAYARDDSYLYDIMTIKDYGLSAFLQNGSFSLQKGQDLHRYYRMLATLPSGYALTTFPLGFQYTLDDVKKELDNYGFLTSVPETLREVFNDWDNYLTDYQELALQMKDIEDQIKKEEIKPLILELKRDDSK